MASLLTTLPTAGLPPPPATHRTYALRQNPKKTPRAFHLAAAAAAVPCKQCGKVFASWKAMFGHMRSHSKRPSTPTPTPTKRPRLLPSLAAKKEQEEAAVTLMMLSKDYTFSKRRASQYHCITCNKSFGSFQALGGHRAAHSRHKTGCAADTTHTVELPVKAEEGMEQSAAARGRHECLICGKVFASGQALGGHKRRHYGIESGESSVGNGELELKWWLVGIDLQH